MKNTYSTYIPKWLPKQIRQLPCDEFACVANYTINQELEREIVPINTTLAGAYTNMSHWWAWKFGRINHYFLAPGLANFLIGSVKELSPDYCKALPECEPIPAPSEDLLFSDLRNHKQIQGAFAIHFPVSEGQQTLIVSPDFVAPLSYTAHQKGYFTATDSSLNCVCLNKDARKLEDNLNPRTLEIAKIVFGLSLYMDAFPDVVVPSADGQIHKVKKYTGSRQIIGMNKVAREESANSVSPHWRRGHYRLLQSETFTRKAGQTVYVKGCFVKGKSFDVTEG